MAASDYTRNMINDAQLRGVAFTLPTIVYVALHTGAPGTNGTADEVDTDDWPAYVRKDSANGGAIATGWSASSSGLASNALQIVWPAHDGVVDVTPLSHWSLWDAPTGGNCLDTGSFTTSRTLEPEQVFVVDPGKLTRQIA